MAKVYAPTSSVNMSVGFDVLGMAATPVNSTLLGDNITVEAVGQLNLYNLGCFVNKLPAAPRKNIVCQCWGSFYRKIGKTIPATTTLEKNIPIGSGLDSSVCSVIAMLVAMNEFCGKLLNEMRVLTLTGETEGRILGSIHYDNVAPCYFGDVQLMIEENGIISQQVPGSGGWLWVLAYPGIKVSTAEARAVLLTQYRHQGYIAHGCRLAGFVHACYTRQSQLTTKLTKDVITEPYRTKLLPGSNEARQATTEIGVQACGIPGSGPVLFALCDKPGTAQRVAN